VKEAEADYQQAMDLLVKLTSEFRGVISHRELLGNVSQNYGQLLRELNRARDAEKVWRASLPLWRRLLEDVPGRPVYRQKLAVSCDELAIALAMTNRLTEVEPLWEEAIGIEEKLVAESPKNAEYWQDLTNSLGNLISVLRVKPLTAALEKTCRQLVDVQERRNKEFPGIAAIESGLAEAHFLLADALLKRSKPAEAREPMVAAIRHQKSALAREPKQPAHEQPLRTYTMALVEAELREGRHAEAKKALDEMLAALPPSRKNAARLTGEQAALVLVRCMTAAKSDAKAAAGYADAAMALLRSAAADGFRDGKALAAQAEWEPLREREDFKQLLKLLDQKP
jgi:tetratricopeptide (TPR) repeat protein